MYIAECGVIYYLGDPKSPAKQKGLSDAETLKEAIENYNLPPSYQPDALVIKIAKKYYEQNITEAGVALETLHKSVHLVSIAANKINDILNEKLQTNIVQEDIPTILQLMIIYYVIFASVEINIVFVGILAFGINSGAYVSEIIRAGINSIDKGQIEAGSSLGLNYPQIMRYIIMPQAIKNILPALGNEFITLVKETSVGAYIGIIELTKASDIVASRTYEYFFPLIIAAIIYLIITLSLSKLISIMERKLNNANS